MAMWLGDSPDEAKPLLARIDLTPMVGVLAGLLALFALSVPTLSETRTHAPECSCPPWFGPIPRDVQVRLSADGAISINEAKASAEQFDLFVATSGRASPETNFFVHVAPHTRYRHVAAMLETFSRNRITHFGFSS